MIEVGALRMGRRFFRTTFYDWTVDMGLVSFLFTRGGFVFVCDVFTCNIHLRYSFMCFSLFRGVSGHVRRYRSRDWLRGGVAYI